MEKTVKGKSTQKQEQAAKKVEAPPAESYAGTVRKGSNAVSDREVVPSASHNPNIPNSNPVPKADGVDAKVGVSDLPKSTKPLVIQEAYPPTMSGLESARMQCRFMMNRIVAEVNFRGPHRKIKRLISGSG